MGLTLGVSLRLLQRNGKPSTDDRGLGTSVAFVGAGGKTTCLFALARELPGPVLVTSTTHLGAWQLDEADAHITAAESEQLGRAARLGREKVTVITGPVGADERTTPASADVVEQLRDISLSRGWPLLIEADGARQKPLKAPKENEPRIPAFTEIVAVVAGLDGLGKPLEEASVHRAELFAPLSGLEVGDPVTEAGLGRVLAHKRGGLKGIPPRARRIAVLNKADSAPLQASAHQIAMAIARAYDAVVVASAESNTVHAVMEPTAGIILAAGGASRFGKPKQLLNWLGESLIHRATRMAFGAGLSPVVVVTGARANEVEAAVGDLPVIIARNTDWRAGQSSSIRTGLDACPPSAAAAVFLLADQPLVTEAVIRTIVEAHASEAAAIVAPLVQGERRGNPVLFDRETFPDLRQLSGDEGGRGIFDRHRIHYVPWHDDGILRDIDTEEDYRKLQEIQTQ
ncbi:MAG TPA: selenium cofactor biosynthesis protein YqeC [Anaerolineales bacterium]